MISLKKRLWTWQAVVLRWVDGDTVDIDIDQGFRLRRQERIRLVGIDAWETRGKEKVRGLLAKERAIDLAPEGSLVFMVTHKNKQDSFGRWLAEVWPADSDEIRSINNILLEEGLAVVYKK